MDIKKKNIDPGLGMKYVYCVSGVLEGEEEENGAKKKKTDRQRSSG
jgi:hypothetical protein